MYPESTTAEPESIPARGFDPEDERQLQRLREVMRGSSDRLKEWKDRYWDTLRAIAGSQYGDNETQPDAFNFLKICERVYRRSLISRTPKVTISSNTDRHHFEAYRFALGLNHQIQKSNVGDALTMAASSAMMGMGIVRVGLKQSEKASNWMLDPGEAFMQHILMDDWLHDVHATSKDEWDWCGHRYRLRLDDVRDNPEFDERARNSVTAPDHRSESAMDGFDGDGSSNLVEGDSVFKETLFDYVDVWDIYIRRENIVVTMTDQNWSMPLMVRDWYGPRGGPYEICAFDVLPGCTIAPNPLSYLMQLNNMFNILLDKIFEQADSQKDVILAGPQASTDGTADSIRTAHTGKVIHTENPADVNQVKIAGADQGNYAVALGIRDLMNMASGNVDAMAGLAPQAETLGQERLLKDSSNATIADFQDSFADFTRRAIRKFAWFVYDDPYTIMQLPYRIENTEVELSVPWEPKHREPDFSFYDIDIDVSTMRSRSPGERLETLDKVVRGVILPTAQFAAQDGITIAWDRLYAKYAQLADVDELSEVVRIGGEPLERQPTSGGQMVNVPGGPQGEYTHRSVSAQQQNPISAGAMPQQQPQPA